MRPYGTQSRLLAGLQAGMAGALLMLGWLLIVTVWSMHSVWWFPNLMATTFGGDPALKTGFGKYSLAGLALHLVQYSALGAVFAALISPRLAYTRLLLLGILVSIGFYYLMFGFVWKHVNPLIPLYSPDRQIIIAHVFYGLMLARVRHYWIASGPIIE